MTANPDPRIELLARQISDPVIWGPGYDWYQRRALACARAMVALVDSVPASHAQPPATPTPGATR